MKQSLLRKVILAVATVFRLLCAESVYASHTMGADLTYECIGVNTYKVTVSFYRDCIGIPAPVNPVVSINSPSCGQSLSVTCYARPGTGQEVTPACSSSVTTCNGGSFTGIQEWVYDGIVTLPMACTDWYLGYSLCCRNAAITTINTPSSNTFYIYATLNNVVTPCNSSPTFSNKPVPFLCLGQQFCFNHGAYDLDGDSLVYKLITPKQTASTNVVYQAPYNAANPLNSSPATAFNSVTGDICLNPQALEVTVMAVLVEEYRNGVKIGSVERDLQLTVMNCANNLPSLSGINGTNNFSITMCANQPGCFNIFSDDPDVGQQLTVDWNHGIPGSTFTTNVAGHPTGAFCWTPPQSAVGHSFTFTATVTDDACPYFGSQTYSYTVNVIGLNVNAGPDQAIACSDLATLTAHASGGNGGPYTYLWSNGSTMQSITVGEGTYTVTASDGNCTATDTVNVTMPFIPVADFTNTSPGCNNIPVVFTDQSTTPGGAITSWNWNFGDGGTSTLQNPTHQFPGVGTFTVTLIIQNNLGCYDTISKPIVIDPPLVMSFSASSACVSTSVNFTSTSTGNPTSWHWDFGDGSTSTQQNPSHTYTNPGTFNVTLIGQNALGCIDTVVQPVTIFPLPVVNAGADKNVCSGNSVTLTASGGSTYTWTPIGMTGQTITYNPVGSTTLIVQVTDANGCINTDTVNVNVNPLPVINAGADQAVCIGQNITLTAAGGVSYVWNPGGSTSSTITVNPVTTTTYTVIGTGANGCTSSDAVVVSVNSLPSANAGPDVNICSGSSTTLTASGGGTYVWSPGGSTSSTISVNPTSSQNYVVTVTNGGCSKNDTVRVNVIPQPTVNLTSFFLCIGATSILDAGNPGSTYSWSTGATTQTISISSGGTYSVTVTNASGCTASASCVVTYDSTIVINLANVTFCQGDSAVLDAGYPGMTYVWTPNGETTQTITVHNSGTYGVTVHDTSGCSGSISISAIANPLPQPNFSNTSVCEGDPMSFTDGSTVTSGSITNWSWDFGDGGTSLIQNPSHNYSSAGTYNVALTATSASGCTNTITNAVTVNSLPVADFSNTDICIGSPTSYTDLSSITSGNITSYHWDFGDGDTSNLQNPTHIFAAHGNYLVTLVVTSAGGCTNTISRPTAVHPMPTADFVAPTICLGDDYHFNSNSTIQSGGIPNVWWDFNDTYTSTQHNPWHLFANSGVYNVKLIVSSAHGCPDTIVKSVTVNALPIVSTGTAQNICASGSITLTATSSFPVVWNPGGLTTSSITVTPTGSTTYTVITTDANGCTGTDAVVVNVNTPPNASAGADQSICSGGSVTLTGAGGTSYSWSPGGMTTSTISVQPTADTDYILTVTDANGCQDLDTVTVHVNSNPAVSAGPDQSICDGSTVSLTSSGATSYLWNPVGMTTSTILVSPTTNSTYTLIGTNAAGCSSYDTVVVTVSPIPVVTLSNSYLCDGYTVTLDAGAPGYSYAWSTGETTQSIVVSDSGTYSVVVTGANGCSAFGTSVVTKFGNQNMPPTNYNACNGTNITLDAGNPGSTYQWNTGQTSQTISVNNPGTYYVTITDIHGCAGTLNHIVAYHPNPVASFTPTSECLGMQNSFTNTSTLSAGTIQNVLWDFGDSYTSISNSPSHLYTSSGNYSVNLIVTSDNGCTDTINQSVDVYPLPVADFSTNPTCLNNSVAFNNLSTVSSGSISNISWNFGDGNTSNLSSPSHSFTSAGNYTSTLIVTTSYGCKDTISQNVTVLDLPVASFQATNACLGSAINFANNSSSTGSPMTSYNWDFGNGSSSTSFQPIFNYSTAGNYTVSLIVNTASGCSDTVSSVITVHPIPVANFNVTPECFGVAVSMQDNSTVSSGTIQNQYWDLGDNSSAASQSPSHNYASQGTYTIMHVVTSDNGCSDSIAKTVDVYPLPQPAFTGQDLCEGNSMTFQNNSTISSGTITQWNWNFDDNSTSNQNAPSHQYAYNGTYNIMLTAVSDHGCIDSTGITVNVWPKPVASFATSNVCFGDGTQFLNTTTVNGGGYVSSSWTFGDGDSTNFANPLHMYQSAGNYSVTLSVVTSNGCTDQVSQPVIVHSTPMARFAAPDSCSGIITHFNNTSTSQDGNITSNIWNFGDGSHSIDVNPSHLYGSPGKYDVQLNVITTFGCIDAYNDSIAINPNPQVNMSLGNACDGIPVQFNASSSQPGINYSWALGNGNTNNSQAFNYTYSAPGTYTVNLVATDSIGCSDNQTNQLVIYPNPVADFSGNEVCENSSTQFHNTSTTPTGASNTYSWNFGDNNQSVNTNPNHTYSTWGVYNVTLTSTTNQGCINSVLRQVRVHPNPIPNFNSGQQGCSPVDALFSENSSIPEGTITNYLWNFSDGSVSTDHFTHKVFTESGNYEAMLTVVSDFGCVNSFTQSNAVTVYSGPDADFVADPMVTDMSAPLIHFYNQSQNYSSYQWTFGDGTSSNDLNPTHTFRDTGTYTATLITVNSMGCRDTVMRIIDVRIHSTLFIANTFTPNGDGKNDDFRPFWTNMKEIKVWIYDRWGKQLYAWNDINGAWDGKFNGNKCQEDTYVYKIVGTGLDGKYSEWVGHVNLIY